MSKSRRYAQREMFDPATGEESTEAVDVSLFDIAGADQLAAIAAQASQEDRDAARALRSL